MHPQAGAGRQAMAGAVIHIAEHSGSAAGSRPSLYSRRIRSR